MTIEISNIFPANGATGVNRNTLVSFDLTTDDPLELELLTQIFVDVGIDFDYVTAYDFGSFISPFDGPESSVVAITDGYHFVIDNTSEYPDVLVIFEVYNGTIYESWEFTIGATFEVLNQNPLAGAIDVSKETLIEFDVVSDSSISSSDISISINDDVIYDGISFISPFDGPYSSAVAIIDGYHFTIDKISEYPEGLVIIDVYNDTMSESWGFTIGATFDVLNRNPLPYSIDVSKETLIEFDVVSNSLILLNDVAIFIDDDVVYDGISFVSPFDGPESSIIAIIDGYHFVIDKTLDYDDKEITVFVTIFSFEDTWTFYVGSPPINVTNRFPLANARGVSEDLLIRFDVVSYADLTQSAIKIYIDNKIIFDNGFIAPFNGPSSNVSAIADGYHFVIDNMLPYDNFVSLRVNYDV
jgi:hypothetical protein